MAFTGPLQIIQIGSYITTHSQLFSELHYVILIIIVTDHEFMINKN